MSEKFDLTCRVCKADITFNNTTEALLHQLSHQLGEIIDQLKFIKTFLRDRE